MDWAMSEIGHSQRRACRLVGFDRRCLPLSVEQAG